MRRRLFVVPVFHATEIPASGDTTPTPCCSGGSLPYLSPGTFASPPSYLTHQPTLRSSLTILPRPLISHLRLPSSSPPAAQSRHSYTSANKTARILPCRASWPLYGLKTNSFPPHRRARVPLPRGGPKRDGCQTPYPIPGFAICRERFYTRLDTARDAVAATE